MGIPYAPWQRQKNRSGWSSHGGCIQIPYVPLSRGLQACPSICAPVAGFVPQFFCNVPVVQNHGIVPGKLQFHCLQPPLLPGHIHLSAAFGPEPGHAALAPFREKGGQQENLAVPALQQHFGNAGSHAEVPVYLEGRVTSEEIRAGSRCIAFRQVQLAPDQAKRPVPVL